MARLRTKLLATAVGGLAPFLAWPASAGAAPAASAPSPDCTVRGSGVVVGTPGNDVICGSAADDTLIGLGGNDVLYGFGGDDTLIGGRGWDRLYGGHGRDRLIDHSGGGWLNGGPGTDRCVGRGSIHFRGCEDSRNVGISISDGTIIIRQP